MRGKIILTLILILVLSLPLTGALCKSNQNQNPSNPVTLKVWLILQDKKSFDNIVAGYRSQNPNVNFEFVEKNEDQATYEKELVDAIAAKNGPDIALIREDWVAKHYDKLVSLPETKDKNQETMVKEFKDTFVQAVSEKMIYDNKIYAIPVKMDTLALYYNVNQFTEARLYHAPKDWNEFVYDVKLLTKRDQYGNLTQSAVAMGTTDNVEHSQDILYTIMIQNGTKMISDDHKSATFNTSITKASGEVFYPGTNAIDFYYSFANPAKETYTWNKTMPNSIRAFADGKVSMIFDYGYRQDEIYNLAPTIHFQVAPMPQIKDTTNPATYPYFWAFGVTNNSSHSTDAWNFIKYLSQTSNSVKKDKTKEAYKSMTEGVSLFQGQPYIARTFYKSREPEQVDSIFQTAIRNVVNGQPLQAALDSASASVTTILQTKG
ncbi:MAG: extracellular solute-binding protein [Candidatus Berkelbacteria bacterium]|nr:extracellular solute-binding protein [Candidatus Berkelbacteria bacterium]